MTSRALFPVAILVATAVVVVATIRDAKTTAADDTSVSGRHAMREGGLPASLGGTSRAELTSTVSTMTARLAADPANPAAVVSLANALIRLQRVNNDGRAVITAEEHLRTFLSRRPDHYEARRMLAAVLLSQHRFADAIREANQTMAADPRDAWNYGAAGDGYMELGDYSRAFDAFDRMGQCSPAPRHARTAYALELKERSDGALDSYSAPQTCIMPNDPESQAWHYADRRSVAAAWPRRGANRIRARRRDLPRPSDGDHRTGANQDGRW